MSKKVSKQTQNNEIKNTKSFCKYNQNRNKTQFLINLDKIGLILGLFQFLLGLIFALFILYLTDSTGDSRYKNSVLLVFGIFIVIIVLFIIKIAYKIKLIKNHEPNKLNCEKIEQNTQQAINSFKKNITTTIYLGIFIIGSVLLISSLNILTSSSSKPIIFKLFSSIITFCYLFIGCSSIWFIRKSKK